MGRFNYSKPSLFVFKRLYRKLELCYFYYFDSFTLWPKAAVLARWKFRVEQRPKSISVPTSSQVGSNITMVSHHHPQCLLPSFWIEGLAVFLFVTIFPSNERWDSSSSWMCSEWNPTGIVLTAIAPGIPTFRMRGRQKADALWILGEENRESPSPSWSFVRWFGPLAFPGPRCLSSISSSVQEDCELSFSLNLWVFAPMI